VAVAIRHFGPLDVGDVVLLFVIVRMRLIAWIRLPSVPWITNAFDVPIEALAAILIVKVDEASPVAVISRELGARFETETPFGSEFTLSDTAPE
jgi:hypothetical protein